MSAPLSVGLFCLLLGTGYALQSDEVTHLPGFNGVAKFRQYSGFLNAQGGRKLHYWFVESQNNPSQDPLVLWMNGGPGCSSLLGLLTENGPFRVSKDSQVITENPYSWNKVANVIFLEAPAGVGFSYDPSGQYATDDDQTADDNLAALQDFFSKYPQFKANDFYVTGESYGGIYVPTLSVRVHKNLQDIKFKGFAVGNGALSFPHLGNALIFFGYYHGLWGSSLWNKLTTYCCDGSVSQDNCNFSGSGSTECAQAVAQASLVIYGSGLNMYNLYGKCKNTPRRNTREFYDRKLIARSLNATGLLDEIGMSPPCIDDANVEDYLNRQDVRQALHVTISPLNFTECSDILRYKQTYNTMLPQVKELVDAGVNMLVYNGDVDMACNFLGDEWFVRSLGYPASSDYKPWQYKNQVAGFAQTFAGQNANITYVTVKGSGHMVPQDKPPQALEMIGNFLFGRSF